jgi:hypothetical protein
LEIFNGGESSSTQESTPEAPPQSDYEDDQMTLITEEV